MFLNCLKNYTCYIKFPPLKLPSPWLAQFMTMSISFINILFHIWFSGRSLHQQTVSFQFLILSVTFGTSCGFGKDFYSPLNFEFERQLCMEVFLKLQLQTKVDNTGQPLGFWDIPTTTIIEYQPKYRPRGIISTNISTTNSWIFTFKAKWLLIN